MNRLEEECVSETDDPFNICISGATNPMMRLLLVELVCGIDYTPKPQEIRIKLFDHYSETRENRQFIKTIMEEFLVLETSVKKSIELVYLIADGLKNCNLFIIADWLRPSVKTALWYLTSNLFLLNCFRGTTNDLNEKIIKKMSMMLLYADIINAFCKRNLRVIVADDGPVCLNATVLVETCTKIRIVNIVAVTSDVGLAHLTEVANQTGIPVQHLGAPPVWGFIGINQYVDLENIIHYSDIYIPFARSLQEIRGSTLPMGKTTPELRFTAYLLEDNEDKFKAVKKRQV